MLWKKTSVLPRANVFVFISHLYLMMFLQSGSSWSLKHCKRKGAWCGFSIFHEWSQIPRFVAAVLSVTALMPRQHGKKRLVDQHWYLACVVSDGLAERSYWTNQFSRGICDVWKWCMTALRVTRVICLKATLIWFCNTFVGGGCFCCWFAPQIIATKVDPGVATVWNKIVTRSRCKCEQRKANCCQGCWFPSTICIQWSSRPLEVRFLRNASLCDSCRLWDYLFI